MKKARSRLVVVGGAGAMGRIAVRDLVESAPPEVELVVADYDLAAARALARHHPGRLRAVQVDVTKLAPSAKALDGAFGLINCCHHALNLPVMQIALRLGAHYTDLGGLFHVTRKQLKLHAQFARRGLLALLGMGAAPGVVNVLARAAADEMEAVDEIHIAVGGVDRTPGRQPGVLGASYSIDTILDEASQPAALFTGGKLVFVEAMSGAEPVEFPAPVGLRRPARTLHSELATLPRSYANKGVREVSFRIAFSDDLADKLRFVRALGLLEQKPLKLGKQAVSPRALLTQLVRRLPAPDPGGPPDEYEVLRVTVRGRRQGRALEELLDCHTAGIPAWGMGIDVDTGCPPSIAMQMILNGKIEARGVLAPEQAVPAEPFFAELAKRGMRVQRTQRWLDEQKASERPR